MEFPKKTPEYDELNVYTEPWGIAYGPIQSRRLGLSLGVNLVGSEDKVCSFNCVFCELGETKLNMSQMKKQAVFPTLRQIEDAVKLRIADVVKAGQTINYITLVGNGEATLYPQLFEAAQLLKKIRDEMLPTTKLGILTNGTTLDSSKVIKALNLLDERMIKLDAGNDHMLAKINRPLVRLTLARLIQGSRKLKDLILQSCFVQGVVDNTGPNEVDDWIEVAGIMRPKTVHIYTLDRVPAISGLKQVIPQKLKEIAIKLEKRTAIKATIYS